MRSSLRRWLAALLLVVLLPVLVSGAGTIAAAFTGLPCSIINEVYTTVQAVGSTLVVIMFTYGGVLYVFHADNPGGRNQGKTICQHAVIGGIMLTLWTVVGALLNQTWWSKC